MTEDRDPYATLGVDASAAADDIAAAYRVQARRHHPDISRAHDAEQRMAEINAAWALLRDPVRRAAWDRAHAVRPVPPLSDATTAAPVGRGPLGRAARGVHDRQAARTTMWRRGPDGEGAAGPPPGSPRGSVLPFGRHIGWSLGEIARVDPGYLVWLQGRPEGGRYHDEIDRMLAALRTKAVPDAPEKRSRRLFR